MALAIFVPANLIDRLLNGLGLAALVAVIALGFILFGGIRLLVRSIFKLSTPAQGTDDGAGYRVYTREFDVVTDAGNLDAVLGQLSASDSASLDEAWAAFSGALQGWRTKAHLEALEAAARIRTRVEKEELENSVVSILIDQSGSMKGQSMLLAAGAADVTSDFLIHLGVAVEVLGFTTAAWHGGKARSLWRLKGSPANPGRLSDLLHIVYRSAKDRRAGTGAWSLRSMLRSDLPKENIDGEALQWAAARLREYAARRRLLIVISDGVPCDDATLKANDVAYLSRHLHQVVQSLQQTDEIRLAAIGIGFDVSHFYKDATTLVSAAELGTTLIDLVERMICEPQRVSASPADRKIEVHRDNSMTDPAADDGR